MEKEEFILIVVLKCCYKANSSTRHLLNHKYSGINLFRLEIAVFMLIEYVWIWF